MRITLDRDVDEDDQSSSNDQIVDAPHYPGKKMVNWWLVVGDPQSRALYGIKKVTVKKSLNTKLDITLPQGVHTLKLYLICDSYMGEFGLDCASRKRRLVDLWN
jgi:pre-mRNA-splicing helicase BRR2